MLKELTMNSQFKKIKCKDKNKNIRRPFQVGSKRKDAVFRQECGPAITGYWG